MSTSQRTANPKPSRKSVSLKKMATRLLSRKKTPAQLDERKSNRKSVSFRKMASRLLSRKKSFSCVVTAPLPVPRRKMSRGDFECEGIAFIQAKDALDWAKFLQGKLYSPDYNIRTTLYSPDHSDIKNVFLKANTCAVLVSPMMLEAEKSEFWRRCKDKFHWRTVFLLLGVDKAELGEDVRRNISSCKLISVDGSPDTVKNTLVKLIEVYESTEEPSKSSPKEWEDEKIYDYPPPPRQLNSVVKVLPTVIYENGREALIVLEREAEQEVYLLQAGNQSSHPIKLDHVAGSAYLAKMPDDVNGKVDFFVMTGEQTLSQLTLTIQTRLEQLAALLEQETSPLALLCSAMGLPSAKYSSHEELDSLLASRLEAVQYPQTLSTILSADEHLSSDQENCQWPTLLHFAADFNLKKVCSILIRYPGTIHAACTENIQGLFPCQLAEKNDFLELKQLLLQYVEDMRLRSAADSGVMVETVPPPSPHVSVSPYYVNDSHFKTEIDSLCANDFDSEYVDMSGLSPKVADEALCELSAIPQQNSSSADCPSPCKGVFDKRYCKPRSMSEGNVKTPYSRDSFGTTSIKEEEDENQSSSPPELMPKTAFHSSFVNKRHSAFRPKSNVSELSGYDVEDQDSSDSCSETIVNSRISCQSTIFSAHDTNLDIFKVGEEKHERLSHGSSETSSIISQLELRGAASDGFTDTPVLRNKNSKRSKSVQDKISHFFKKIKPSRKQSSSDGELQAAAKAGKKPIVYTRQSAGSDPGQTSTLKKSDSQRSSASSEVECTRDSGAVCDEERSPVIQRQRFKIPSSFAVGKKKNITMNRRMSIRVEKAKQMEIRELPTLPPKSKQDSRETFVSFLEKK